jgi:hypothetical protein
MAHFYKIERSEGRNLREDEQKIYEVGKAVTAVTSLITKYLSRYIFLNRPVTSRYIIVNGLHLNNQTKRRRNYRHKTCASALNADKIGFLRTLDIF